MHRDAERVDPAGLSGSADDVSAAHRAKKADFVEVEPTDRVVDSPGIDFDSFCRREYAAVAGLAYVLTGSWTTAEDLTQDAFFAAYRQWNRLCEYDKPGGWVRRVVANRAVSWRRRVGVEARALARMAARRPAAHDRDFSENDDELWIVVRGLPPRQTQVFALTYVNDMDIHQVAAVLEISESTAKTHLQRARASLSARLRGDSDGEHRLEQKDEHE